MQLAVSPAGVCQRPVDQQVAQGEESRQHCQGDEDPIRQ